MATRRRKPAKVEQRLGAACAAAVARRIERERATPADPEPRGQKAVRAKLQKKIVKEHALAKVLADRENAWTLSTASARRELPDWWPTPEDGRSNAAARFERLAGELRELEAVAGAAAAMIPGTPGELPNWRRAALVRDLALILAKHGHAPSDGSDSRLVAALRHAWERLAIDRDARHYLRDLSERGGIDFPALRVIARGARQSADTERTRGGRSKQTGADPPP